MSPLRASFGASDDNRSTWHFTVNDYRGAAGCTASRSRAKSWAEPPPAQLGRPRQNRNALAHAPGAQRRLQSLPEFLIGDDKRVVGGRTRMRQAVAPSRSGSEYQTARLDTNRTDD